MLILGGFIKINFYISWLKSWSFVSTQQLLVATTKIGSWLTHPVRESWCRLPSLHIIALQVSCLCTCESPAVPSQGLSSFGVPAATPLLPQVHASCCDMISSLKKDVRCYDTIRCIQLLTRGATGSGTGTRTTLRGEKKSAIFVCEASSEHGVSGTGAQHTTVVADRQAHGQSPWRLKQLVSEWVMAIAVR